MNASRPNPFLNTRPDGLQAPSPAELAAARAAVAEFQENLRAGRVLDRTTNWAPKPTRVID